MDIRQNGLGVSVNLSVTEVDIAGKRIEKPLDLTLFPIFNHIY